MITKEDVKRAEAELREAEVAAEVRRAVLEHEEILRAKYGPRIEDLERRLTVMGRPRLAPPKGREDFREAPPDAREEVARARRGGARSPRDIYRSLRNLPS